MNSKKEELGSESHKAVWQHLSGGRSPYMVKLLLENWRCTIGLPYLSVSSGSFDVHNYAYNNCA